MRIDTYLGNTEYILPYVVDNNYLFVNDLVTKCYMIDCATMILINVLYVAKSTKHMWFIKKLLNEEPNIYNTGFEDGVFCVTFKVPKRHEWTARLIHRLNREDFLKSHIINMVKFWENKAYEVLSDEKTRAARESSSGYFFNFY